MIVQKLEKLDFDHIGKIAVSEIAFEPSLIDLCKMNTCGNYGKSYTCPPLVGETDELIRRTKTYQTAVVFQKIYPLEDSFDIEGMNAARHRFQKALDNVRTLCQNTLTDYLLWAPEDVAAATAARHKQMSRAAFRKKRPHPLKRILSMFQRWQLPAA